MKKILSLLLFTLLLSIPFSALATTVAEELDRMTGVVAKLQLGFGNYFVGQQLTEAQKVTAQNNSVMKALKGTYKFKDGEVYVVVTAESDTVLGVYKEYKETTFEALKPVIGALMFEHGEPTAMAHNKLIYWTYDKNGKIEQDVFEFARSNGGAKSLVTVKFSSSEPIVEKMKEEKQEKNISAYAMITSDPLSKLFLAHTKNDKQ
jgi:antitoxin component YwqK of YwqJK toxin-antitoxin module